MKPFSSSVKIGAEDVPEVPPVRPRERRALQDRPETLEEIPRSLTAQGFGAGVEDPFEIELPPGPRVVGDGFEIKVDHHRPDERQGILVRLPARQRQEHRLFEVIELRDDDIDRRHDPGNDPARGIEPGPEEGRHGFDEQAAPDARSLGRTVRAVEGGEFADLRPQVEPARIANGQGARLGQIPAQGRKHALPIGEAGDRQAPENGLPERGFSAAVAQKEHEIMGVSPGRGHGDAVRAKVQNLSQARDPNPALRHILEPERFGIAGELDRPLQETFRAKHLADRRGFLRPDLLIEDEARGPILPGRGGPRLRRRASGLHLELAQKAFGLVGEGRVRAVEDPARELGPDASVVLGMVAAEVGEEPEDALELEPRERARRPVHLLPVSEKPLAESVEPALPEPR